MTLRIGHRGASGTHPENTLAAFRRAVELGCQGVEFDVHRTADGELVVMHDAFVDRTTDGSGIIMAMTLDQMKALDAGVKKGAQFKGERVPTLRELIRETPKELLLFCELKAGSVHYPGIEQELLALIEAEGAAPRFQISSFDHQALRRIHQLAPSMPLGMLTSCNHIDPVGMAKAIGATAIHPTWEWVTEALVNEAHAAGLDVNTWVVDLPPFIEMMKSYGVDGIMSNYPDRV